MARFDFTLDAPVLSQYILPAAILLQNAGFMEGLLQHLRKGLIREKTEGDTDEYGGFGDYVDVGKLYFSKLIGIYLTLSEFDQPCICCILLST